MQATFDALSAKSEPESNASTTPATVDIEAVIVQLKNLGDSLGELSKKVDMLIPQSTINGRTNKELMDEYDRDRGAAPEDILGESEEKEE